MLPALASAQGVPATDPALTTLAAKVEKIAESQERQEAEVQAKLDEVRSGKLIAKGFSGGIALAIQTPLPGRTRQENAASALMPYVLIMPFYWGYPEAAANYCASTWGGGDERTAQSAASGVAKIKAEALLPVVESAISAGEKDGPIGAHLLGGRTIKYTDKDGKHIDHTATDAVAAIRAWISGGKNSEARLQIINWLAALDWNPALRGSCALTKFGFFIGKPLTYTVLTSLRVDQAPSVEASRTDYAERDVVPVIAFGIGFSPNAYFSVLAGTTLNNVEFTKEDGSQFSRTAWALSFGIGGNLDVLGSLFK